VSVKTNATNPYLHALIKLLLKASRENKAKIWRAVAELLQRPKRKRIAVNVGKIDKVVKEGEVIVVPGKVLGAGEIKKKVIVAAWRFSVTAKEKIEKAGGKAISIPELIDMNPKGSNVRIIV